MFMRLIFASHLVLIVSLFALVTEVNSQESERRFSITLQGGVSLATANDVARLAGAFEASSGIRPIYGGSIQYAISPLWSLEGTFHMGTFENEEEVSFNFKNDYMAISIRNIINLNQLFQTNRVSGVINPYILIGIGALMSDLESDDGPYENTDLNFIGGIGLSFYLSRTIDFFVQYDYNIVASNLVDGRDFESRNFESDQFATAQGGLRFNFGRSDARHSSWRRPPVEIFEEDYERLMALGNRIDNLERRTVQRDDEIKRLEQKLLTQNRQLEGIQNTQSDIDSRINSVESQLANIDKTLSDMDTRRARTTPPVPDDEGLVSDLPDGYYVQVFASHSLSSAQEIRQNVITKLDGTLENPSDMVIISQRQNLYEVRIGAFESRFADTVDVLRTAQNEYSDAFVITFPRPAHLREFYQPARQE